MRKLVGWGAVIAVLVAITVGVLGWWLDWDWGDVPTWVGGMATMTALGAAGVGAYFAYRQLGTLRDQVQVEIDALKLQADQFAADRAELERRNKQEMELRRIEVRRQAELVEVLPEAQAAHLGGGVMNNVLTLRVDNASVRPIRNIACRMDMKPYWLQPYGWGETSQAVAGNVILELRPLAPLPVMRRAKTATFFFPVQEREGQGVPASTHVLWSTDQNHAIIEIPPPVQEMFSPTMVFIVRFTDDAGLHWELTDDMGLTQIADRNDW